MPALISLLKADLLRLQAPSDTEPGRLRLLRSAFNPRFAPVLLIRLAHACSHVWVLRPLAHVFTWLNVLAFGIECTPRCEIGPGLLIPHSSGTVIGASRIGCHATIFQGVTLGAIEVDLIYDPSTRPVLEDHVTVGAGAKVLGHVRLGKGAKVGANAVVLQSVPAGHVAVGVPARVLDQGPKP
ncbi:serine acetyltransferase [Paucibacter sp. DJ1R-11]|uniref:serine O-acetyltransferase n=1 Tax=Paucibacter sp. DJ1R-11 TaxID=2893556 RepID=UPI0021E464CC|nr:serine acetyltransferase [Paucibacter sp. DJ1R-11]MCV2364699.1 serine acetyltransferase [Paucibacter sp. DJ1R-11]